MENLNDGVSVADVEQLFLKNIRDVLGSMLCWKPTCDNYAKLLNVESQLVRDFWHFEMLASQKSTIPAALDEEVEEDEY